MVCPVGAPSGEVVTAKAPSGEVVTAKAGEETAQLFSSMTDAQDGRVGVEAVEVPDADPMYPFGVPRPDPPPVEPSVVDTLDEL